MAESLCLKIQRLPHGRGLPLPEPASERSAGLDLRAAVEEEMILAPGERAAIPTGLVLELPPGCEGQVRPRSGLALRHGVTLLNTPGTIDSDYRGEVRVIMINHGQEPYVVRRGDRVAQLVIAAVVGVSILEVEIVAHTDRGDGGFGSTGID